MFAIERQWRYVKRVAGVSTQRALLNDSVIELISGTQFHHDDLPLMTVLSDTPHSHGHLQ